MKTIIQFIRRPVFVAVCIFSFFAATGCARIPYNPHLPTDFVGYRYTLHRHVNRTFTQTSSTHGNVRVTTTTISVRGLGSQELKYLDKTPHVAHANIHILANNPGILKMPFRSVDGSTEDSGYKPFDSTAVEPKEED